MMVIGNCRSSLLASILEGAIKSWSKSCQRNFHRYEADVKKIYIIRSLSSEREKIGRTQEGLWVCSFSHGTKEHHRIEHYEVFSVWLQCTQNLESHRFLMRFYDGRTITIIARTWACRCIFNISLYPLISMNEISSFFVRIEKVKTSSCSGGLFYAISYQALRVCSRLENYIIESKGNW